MNIDNISIQVQIVNGDDGLKPIITLWSVSLEDFQNATELQKEQLGDLIVSAINSTGG